MLAKNKINIAILSYNNMVPAWLLKSFKEIHNSNYARIELVISCTSPKKKSPSFLLYIYSKIDLKLFKPDKYAFDICDLRKESWLKEDSIFMDIDDKGSLSEKDSNVLKSTKLDLIFLCGNILFNSNLIFNAKFGIWKFKVSNSNYEETDGLFEVMKNIDFTCIELLAKKELDAEFKIIEESFSSTNKRSVSKSQDVLLWKASSFLPQNIERIYNFGEDWFFEKLEIKKNQEGKCVYDLKYYSNGRMFKFLFIWAIRRTSEVLQKLFYKKQWILLYSLQGKRSDFSFDMRNFKKLMPPKDKFWADPFVVAKNGNYYVFFEELEFKNNKGYLAYFSIDVFGNVTNPQKILEKEYHLSYPFVFEFEGTFYMVPESRHNKSIDLYQCVQFPDRWEFVKCLMKDVNAVDTTLLYKDNKWWMFVNIQRNDGASVHDELFIYFSEILVTDNWQSHMENPVVSDVRKARSAGKLFVENDNLYRPSQDSSKRYGYAIKINRIVKLDEFSYQESEVNSIYPCWEKGLIATHTLNFEKNFTILDAQYLRSRFKK